MGAELFLKPARTRGKKGSDLGSVTQIFPDQDNVDTVQDERSLHDGKIIADPGLVVAIRAETRVCAGIL